MYNNLDFPPALWEALITARWVKPSFRSSSRGFYSSDATASIALIDAIKSTPGYESFLFTMMLDIKDFCRTCAIPGEPEVLQYLWKIYSTTDSASNDLLVIAPGARKVRGVRMIEWLLGQGLDVNYLTVPEKAQPQGDPIW